MPLLSVIVPVYNEEKTIAQILEKIHLLDIDKEIIIVDNASTDKTIEILRGITYSNLKVIYHLTNRGKGAAFLTGLASSAGEFVIIQDADLEYDPNDYFKLMAAIKGGSADFVFGSRFSAGYYGLYFHRLGNKFLTSLFNFLFGSRLTDYATCYKLARKSAFEALRLKAAGFDIDVEIASRAIKAKMRIEEVAVSYSPRTYHEGKKIRWKDGLWAILYMLKYRIF